MTLTQLFILLIYFLICSLLTITFQWVIKKSPVEIPAGIILVPSLVGLVTSAFVYSTDSGNDSYIGIAIIGAFFMGAAASGVVILFQFIAKEIYEFYFK